MNRFSYPPNLFKSWRKLTIFMASCEDITTEYHMKEFENYINMALPDWDNEYHTYLYNFLFSISNSRIKRDTNIRDHGRDKKIFNLVKDTHHECCILWCRPYIITSWFKISGKIFIKWNREEKCYKVDRDRKYHSPSLQQYQSYHHFNQTPVRYGRFQSYTSQNINRIKLSDPLIIKNTKECVFNNEKKTEETINTIEKVKDDNITKTTEEVEETEVSEETTEEVTESEKEEAEEAEE